MNNIDKMLIAAYFAVLFVSIIIVCNICIYELEKLNTRLDNINKFIQDSGLLKLMVNLLMLTTIIRLTGRVTHR